MSNTLFESYMLGDLTLSNRMVMAPLTRNRANMDGLVSELMQTYYSQRASAGLLIAESTPVSPQGVGYPMTPAIYTAEQADSWKPLTESVHQKEGKIFLQLQHCGRISHPSFQPDQSLPVAPSAIKPDGQSFTFDGPQDYVTPRALETSEIKEIVQQFKTAAMHAKDAGFDGVEIHGANGYLIDQFLRDGTNQRDDTYGGTIENRMRLLNEIIMAVLEIWPSNRIGVRISPENSFNSMSDSNPQMHFEYVAEKLNDYNLAYLHVLEGDMMSHSSQMNYRMIKSKFKNTYIANNGYDLDKATQALNENKTDLVAFGVPFLANPDLVKRFQENLPLNTADHETFYMGAEKGYTDYPFYE